MNRKEKEIAKRLRSALYDAAPDTRSEALGSAPYCPAITDAGKVQRSRGYRRAGVAVGATGMAAAVILVTALLAYLPPSPAVGAPGATAAPTTLRTDGVPRTSASLNDTTLTTKQDPSHSTTTSQVQTVTSGAVDATTTNPFIGIGTVSDSDIEKNWGAVAVQPPVSDKGIKTVIFKKPDGSGSYLYSRYETVRVTDQRGIRDFFGIVNNSAWYYTADPGYWVALTPSRPDHICILEYGDGTRMLFNLMRANDGSGGGDAVGFISIAEMPADAPEPEGTYIQDLRNEISSYGLTYGLYTVPYDTYAKILALFGVK